MPPGESGHHGQFCSMRKCHLLLVVTASNATQTSWLLWASIWAIMPARSAQQPVPSSPVAGKAVLHRQVCPPLCGQALQLSDVLPSAGRQVCASGHHAGQGLGQESHQLRHGHQLHRVHLPAASGLRLCAPGPGAWLPGSGEEGPGLRGSQLGEVPLLPAYSAGSALSNSTVA